MRMRARVALAGALMAVSALALGPSGCDERTGVTPELTCPNKLPQADDPCTPGLTCSYADQTGCAPLTAPYFAAECTAAGKWLFEDPCDGKGGAAGHGGSGASVGPGGQGGGGGEGPCVDPVEGPPTVISPDSKLLPPDATQGFYRLQFSEAVSGVATHLSWSGPGQLGAVTKAGQAYNVYFSGMAPGDVATLTVEEVPDSCGTAMVEPAYVTIEVRPSCHYLAESFESSVPASGWSAQDNGASGNVWQRNDIAGASNHTSGSGSCATTNDATAGAGAWNTELHAPAIDLTNGDDVVVRYRSDFKDNLGGGDAWLEASANGSSWTALAHFSADRGPTDEAVDLAAYVGGQVYLRWRYTNAGDTGSWWDIDDVCVEEFTKVNCPCPAGGYSEQNDVAGVLNGNGTLGLAEPTLAFLSAVGQRVTMCGFVEGGTPGSGADYFGFVVNSGMPAGAIDATVSYCVENSFQNATTDVWVKTSGVPLSTVTSTTKSGSYDVQLVDGKEHFLSVTPGASDYKLSRYSYSVEIKNIPTPLITEGFESWPPTLTVTDDDPCLDWNQSSTTVVPPGGLPPQGQNLAYFNSYDCPMGTESLESAPLNLVGKTTVMLSFSMFHDTGYPNSFDEIQIEYNEIGTWLPIGLPVVRPGAVEGWEVHTFDLNQLAGKASVRIRLKATTAYGNNIHIDNVLMTAN